MAIPENPITRKETFLAKAAGQEVSLPEDTLTREEAYLREIAEGGGGKGGGIPISQIKDLSAFDEVVNIDDPNMTFLSAIKALGSKTDNSKVTTNTKVYFVMQSGKGFYCLSLISYVENSTIYYFGAEIVGSNYPAIMQLRGDDYAHMSIAGNTVDTRKIYSYSDNGFRANIIAIGIIYQ